ncbi:MAG: pseudouridine synthase, partial [Gammaproteobacteria bacterium]|nr:pseudouridine synthase [Gammaproteobacteria bacterium]
MSFVSYLSPQPEDATLPQSLPIPFASTPHPMAISAALQLQKQLPQYTDWQHDFFVRGGGKMFGVLLVRDGDGRIAFLSAYTGAIADRWDWPGFVLPVFNLPQREEVVNTGEQALAVTARQIQNLREDTEYSDLQTRLGCLDIQREDELAALREHHRLNRERRQLQRKTGPQGQESQQQLDTRLSFESQQDKRERQQVNEKWAGVVGPVKESLRLIDEKISTLQATQSASFEEVRLRMLDTYRLHNFMGEQRSIVDLFDDGRVPEGAGDCVAPKLLHAAQQLNLVPLALAEFWWGASPSDEIRHHGQFYPACRGRCFPILPFMLRGLNVEPAPVVQACNRDELAIVYEDDEILVVNKPAGLLSVPGKEIRDSVLIRLQERLPDATGPILLHRLDMSTSGLLLAAKNAEMHKALQKQFVQRQIEKRYVAILAATLPKDKGMVELPLRVDLHDRPRQLVC